MKINAKEEGLSRHFEVAILKRQTKKFRFDLKTVEREPRHKDAKANHIRESHIEVTRIKEMITI